MKCSSCGTDNDAGSKFCMTCGSPLAEAGPAATTEPSAMSNDEDTPSPESPAAETPGPETPAAESSGPEAPTSPEPSASSGSPAYPPPPAAVPTPPAPQAPQSWDPHPTPPPPAPPGPGQAPTQTTPPPPPGPAEWGAPGGAPAPTAPPPSPAPQAPGWGGPQQAAYPPPGAGYPPPGAPGAPGGPGMAPPAPPQVPAGPLDPNGLGVAAGRLANGPRKQARAAFAVAGAVLEPGERVEALVAGKYEGNPALVILTDRGLLLVDDRPWKPIVERIDVDGSLQVQGMQDNRTASLAFHRNGGQQVVDQIADRALAVEMAQRIRHRSGG